MILAPCHKMPELATKLALQFIVVEVISSTSSSTIRVTRRIVLLNINICGGRILIR